MACGMAHPEATPPIGPSPGVREAMSRPAWRDAGGSVSSMGMTNRDRVDRGMGHLANCLGPFVNKQMAEAFPGGKDWVKVLAARNPSRYSAGQRYSLSDP